MLVKFFHNRGTANSDSAMAYLLSEAPLKYLTGSRNRQGVVRNPAPAVVKGSPELTRKLINQCRNKNKYTSGVISCERMISKTQEKEIIRRFEKIAFAGLREHQFQCLWIRHSHLARTELHFLVPKTELTSQKSLNICPPRLRKEGLYDAFRKLINHEFNLKDPSGIRLSPAEHDRLAQKLAKLVAARATYNRKRYPVINQERVKMLAPGRVPNGARPIDGSLAAAGSGSPQSQPTTRPALDQFDRATQSINHAGQQLAVANGELGRAAGAVQGRLTEALSRRKRAVISKGIFDRYQIPASSASMSIHDREDDALILEHTKIV